MPCSIQLGWKFRNRSLRLEAVWKLWQMTAKSTQLISICSTVNEELQCIHTDDFMTVSVIPMPSINGQIQLLTYLHNNEYKCMMGTVCK